MTTHNIELLVTLGFLAALMWGMLKFMLRDIHRDLSELKSGQERIDSKINKAEMRIDHLFEENNRLYKILVELVQKK